jgi:hypothetical protein
MALSSLSFATILRDGTPTSITAINNGGGCQFGSTLFTNFSIASSTESGSATTDAIDPNMVQLAFRQTGNILDVVTSNSNALSWSLSGNGQLSLFLTYTVTGGLPAYFNAFYNSMNASATGTFPNSGGVTFDKSANGQNLPTTLNTGTPTQAPLAFTGAPISTFNVSDNLHVQANNATATLTDATNSFVVPEPMTSVLLGCGLLAGSFMFRRRKLS